jgi:regulator of RNase E activity RraB
MSDAETRASHAKYLLEDPLLSEVFDEIEKAAVSAWLQTGVGMEAEREFAFHAAKAVYRIRETLKSIVDNGLIAAARAVRPLGKP